MGNEPHRSHVTDASMQRRLRRALADQWPEDVDASLLRLFVEASSLCRKCRSCEEHRRGIFPLLLMVAASEITEHVSSVRAVDVHTGPSHH